jgi:hypothetical protein
MGLCVFATVPACGCAASAEGGVVTVRGVGWTAGGTAVTAMVVAMLLAGPVAGQAGSLGTKAAATPDAVPNPHLNAISCRSASLCMAVGAFGADRPTMRPYSQIWDGTAWRVLVTPGPAHAHQLSSVSCVSRTSCVAVGEASFSSLFADAWNGRRWRVLTVPSLPEMSSVSCPAVADCVAVGTSSGNAVAAKWDGKTWQALTMPAVPGAVKNGLGSVSCARSTSCIAVGSYTSSAAGNPQVTLAEAWNGTTWTLLVTPAVNPVGSVLSAVSCATAASCVAVGLTGSPFFGPDSVLAEGWDGHSWTVLPAAIPPGATTSKLFSVSCAGSSSCMAVGGFQVPHHTPAGLAESWNGTTWKVTKRPGTFAAGAVSCPALKSCVDIGGTLAEFWNGSTWRTLRTLRFDSFSGISCTRRTRCMAVGGYVSPSGRSLTLAERWNGSRWLVRRSPTPARLHSLSDVSCVGSAFCLAVGVSIEGRLSFAEKWNGQRWRLLRAPPVNVTSVSCGTSRSCVAVGRPPGQIGRTVAAIWNGRTWRTLKAAGRGSGLTQLSDVSCITATRCVAVGFHQPIGQEPTVPVAERWNGRTWRILATELLPPGELNAVDCTSRSSCMAVGSGLAAQWNGRTWRALKAPGSVGLADVSCVSSNDCLAVSSYIHMHFTSPVGSPFQVAEHWNGRRWSSVRTPMPGGALAGVSCVRGLRCIAVGEAGGLNTRTLAEQWNGIRLRVMQTRNP